MDKTKLLRAGVLLPYPLAYLYLRFVFDSPFTYESIGVTIFTVLFVLVNELICIGRGKKITAETIFWYVVLVLTAVTADMAPSYAVSMLGLHLCAVYAVLASGGVLTEGKTGSFILTDLLQGFFVRTFPNMGLLFEDIKEFFGKKADEAQDGHASKSLFSLLGAGILLLMLPLFFLAVSLLGDINPAFARAVNDIWNLFDWDIEISNIIIRCIFAVPVCLYLYGLISSCAKDTSLNAKIRLEKALKAREGRRNVPSGFTCFLEIAFALLYLVFFVFEAGTLSTWFQDRFLVVEYARRGFFELVGIMVINMIIFLVANTFAKREGIAYKLNRIFLTVLMSESVVFSMLSFLKLYMYFYKWGYTIKRMLAMWGSLVLGVAAVLAIISIVKKKDRSGLWIRFTAVSYVVMCLATGLCTVLEL